MEIITTVDGVRKQVKEWRKEGLSVGLVPTMGYLHEGHKSLIDKAVAENDRVVVSVFVNPIQFGPTEDLASYPRDLDRDAELCEKAGANVIFHPEDSEMYFDDFCTYVDMDDLTKGLCGKTRPTHFRGVCTVVSKLFHIVAPDRAYFGQKDAQQLAVIRRMVRDLNFDIEIVGCPIVREADGLAKSSRNTYLSAEERTAATVLHKGLTAGEELLRSGEKNAAKVVAEIRKVIENEPLAKIDYVELVDWNTLKPVETVSGEELWAVAVYIGKRKAFQIQQKGETDLDNNEYIQSVNEYSDLIYRVALHACGNQMDAEDMVQNVFIKLFQHKKPFTSEEHKKSWLIRVTVNECHTLFRSVWKSRVQPMEQIECSTQTSMELPAKYRVLIDLYYYEDYSVKEIADILKMNVSTIQTRLMRARKMLKEKLEGGMTYERKRFI